VVEGRTGGIEREKGSNWWGKKNHKMLKEFMIIKLTL